MRAFVTACLVFAAFILLAACNATKGSSGAPPAAVQLMVAIAGTGAGTVASNPSGMNCSNSSCNAQFNSGTTVTLTATPSSGSNFEGWSGGCTGTGACQLTVSSNQSVTATFASTTAGGQVPRSGHVVILMEENHSYSQVIGNPAMPYFNYLAQTYGLATQYYANVHNSLGAYFWITAGRGKWTPSDNHIVRQLLLDGKTWKAYMESLPNNDSLGDRGPYLKRHNPFAFFTDVMGSEVQSDNIVDFSSFASDLANDSLPEYSFISPDVRHDAHDGSLAEADVFLQEHIAPLLASPSFRRAGILVITFDEGRLPHPRDNAHGGGHVATIIVSPFSKRRFRSSAFYQHQSVLKLTCRALGLTSCPGAANNASEMGEFFR